MNCTVCGQPLNEAAPTCPSCGHDSRLTVVAPDGSRYGPYTVLQVRQFATQGRVPPNGSLQAANGTVFLPAQIGIGAPAPAYPQPYPTYRPAPARAAGGKSNTCLIVGIVVGAVVLVCGGILGAILFPVFAKARQKAQQVSCMGNLQQISAAVMQYTTTSGLALPNAATWKQDIQPYLSDPSVLQCAGSGKGQESYVFNPELSNVPLPMVADPYSTPLIYDAGFADGTDPPHDGGWNVLYADGHVGWVQPNAAGALDLP